MTQREGLAWGEFSTADAAAAAGVTKNVISDWITRELISIGYPGRGKDRIFTLWNVVEAVIAANLNKLGIRSGPLKQIMSVLEFEANKMNSATKKLGGYDDFVAVIRFDPDGSPNSIYREAQMHRQSNWVDDEAVLAKLTIDVGIAIAHARKVLNV